MGHLFLKRLNSISGLVLAFAYLVCFLLPYSASLSGTESFDLVQLIVKRISLASIFDLVIVVPALLFHIVAGLSIIYTSEFNVISYGNYNNWMGAMRRISGIILIPFLAYHIFKTKVHFAFTDQFPTFAYMQKLLGENWIRALYIAGVLAASFHIGNGFASILFGFGITQSKKSQDVTAMIMWALTLILAIWGIIIVFSF